MADFYSEKTLDTIIGSTEDDSIQSTGIRSLILGSDGVDTINGFGYFSTISGGADRDLLLARTNNISINGDEGNDFLVIELLRAPDFFSAIGNVTLTGGDGYDTFLLYGDYGYRIVSSTITDFNANEDSLGFVDNYSNYYLTLRRNVNRELEFRTYDSGVNFTLKGITHFSDIANAQVRYGTENFSYMRSKLRRIQIANGLNEVLSWSRDSLGDAYVSDGWASVSSNFDGDVRLDVVNLLSSHTLGNIDAVEDTVSGRMLAGDENGNEIYGSDYGSKMWGGIGGRDFLYGGNGVDTFYAGKDEGSTFIRQCSDEDVVCLWNVSLEDIAGIQPDRYPGYGNESINGHDDIDLSLPMTKVRGF